MKAITIWQPWATLILEGAKPFEFRGWFPPRAFIGQRIAIHAGARKPNKAEIRGLLMALRGGPFIKPCLHADKAKPILEAALTAPGSLPLSAVLCTAILGEPKRGDRVAIEDFNIHPEDVADANDSDRDGTFNWGWPLTDIKPLVPPRDARGAQGFWNWSEE